ncbi:FtsX-like permease family protein [Candidatus Izimaplasma bacterium ZiA1]|uniref:ABC transporter permease n=1 Tax=Candidatus Izimoplasma sp. ZiA1 TaxID=2024899 RepID=UPI0014386F38
MRSVIKVTVKHITSHLGRGTMLIISIMFSAGLVYAMLNMSTLTTSIVKDNFLKDFGDTNVVVYQLENNEILMNVGEGYDTDYNISTNNLYGYSTFEADTVVNLKSYSLNELDTIYDIEYLQKSDSVQGKYDIVIGEENHYRYDLELGDELVVNVSGTLYTFTIYAISVEGNSFLDANTNTLDINVNNTFVTEDLGITNPNLYMINISDFDDIKLMISEYSDLEVIDLLNDESYLTNMNMIETFLTLMASSVVLISAFIIYSTYKIIVIERLAFIGTLRSIGATKKYSSFTMILESIIYGIIGGIIGVFIGILILLGIFKVFFTNTDIAAINVDYINIGFILGTLVFALVLTVLSSLIPILKVRKYSIKQIMFEEIKNNKQMKYLNVIVGSVLILIATVLVNVSNYQNELVLSAISLLLVIIGSVMLIPLLIRVISPVINLIFYPIFKNKTTISLKNIKNDKTLINNIVLLAIGLGFIFMINNFASSVNKVVADVYGEGMFDIVIQDIDVPDQLIEDVSNLDGVTNTYVSKTVIDAETSNGFVLPFLTGIDIVDYNQYAWDDFSEVITSELIQDFENEDTIIISDFMLKKYNLKVGDIITLSVMDEEYDLTIIKSVSSILYNGTLAFIDYDLLETIYGDVGNKSLFINTDNDLEETKITIKRLYSNGILPIETLDDMEQTNQDTNDMMFFLMKAMSFLAMGIGAIGIINNFTVSFVSRRKIIANLRSLGLSKKGTSRLLIIESLLTGIIGSILGVGFGVLFFKFASYLVEAVNITSEMMSYVVADMVFVFVGGIVISLVASIYPARKLSQKNIVEEIKYEG